MKQVSHTTKAKSAISRFAFSFKTYGISLGLIVAAMPVITKATGLLPIYSATKNILTFSTTLISLLAIAVLFGCRRQIGQAVFPPAPGRCISRAQAKKRFNQGVLSPILLCVLGIVALASYLMFINWSINAAMVACR